jgi:DNA repair protein RadC
MTIRVKIEKLTIYHSLDIYEIMQMVLKRDKKINKLKENFWVISLNNANRILNLELVSVGNVTNTIVKPMEVLSIPLQKRAVGVILVHNHPSGRLEPSEEDKELTDKLIQACKLMNTPVLDHVIITENSYYSFKSSGLLERLEASNKYVLPYDLERQYHEEMEEEIKRIEKENAKRIKESLQKGEEKGLKKGRQEGIEKGMQQGAENEKLEIAKSMLKDGEPIEKIMKWTGLSLQDIENLKTEL